MARFEEQLGGLFPFTTTSTTSVSEAANSTKRRKGGVPQNARESSRAAARRRGVKLHANEEVDSAATTAASLAAMAASVFSPAVPSTASPADHVVRLYSNKIRSDEARLQQTRLAERVLIGAMQQRSQEANGRAWEALRRTHGGRFDFVRLEHEMSGVFANKELRVVVDSDEAIARLSVNNTNHSSSSYAFPSGERSAKGMISCSPQRCGPYSSSSSAQMLLPLEEADGDFLLRNDGLVELDSLDDEAAAAMKAAASKGARGRKRASVPSLLIPSQGSTPRGRGKRNAAAATSGARGTVSAHSVASSHRDLAAEGPTMVGSFLGDDYHSLTFVPTSDVAPDTKGKKVAKTKKGKGTPSAARKNTKETLTTQSSAATPAEEEALRQIFSAARVVDSAALESSDYNDLLNNMAVASAATDVARLAGVAGRHSVAKAATSEGQEGAVSRSNTSGPSLDERIDSIVSAAVLAPLLALPLALPLAFSGSSPMPSLARGSSSRSTCSNDHFAAAAASASMCVAGDAHQQQPVVLLEALANPMFVAAVKEGEAERDRRATRLRRAIACSTPRRIAEVLAESLGTGELERLSKSLGKGKGKAAKAAKVKGSGAKGDARPKRGASTATKKGGKS